MATFRLSVQPISRGRGQSAIAAAAYRSGTRLHDARRDEVQDYTPRAATVLFNGVFAPQDAPEWARDREQLWNRVEAFEKRKDAQLAREFQLNLPHELTDQQREWLLKDFIREQFTRRGFAVDAAIHAPDREGDQRNVHAHLLVTLRTIDANGFANIKDRSLNTKEQLSEWREHWAHLTNHHLERHNIKDANGNFVTVDHRSYAERGLDVEPTKHEGKVVTALERQGVETDRRRENDAIRERNAALIPQPTSTIELPADRAPAPGRDDLTPPADLWERGTDVQPGAPASIARQLAPDQRTGLDAPPNLWERDEGPAPAPDDTRRRAAAPLDPEHDWTSRGGMVAQQASAAIWARDAANRQQAEERQQRAASPVQTVADQLERRTEETPAPGAAPVKSAQEIAREKYLAAFDSTHAKNVQEREQGRDGGRELDR